MALVQDLTRDFVPVVDVLAAATPLEAIFVFSLAVAIAQLLGRARSRHGERYACGSDRVQVGSLPVI